MVESGLVQKQKKKKKKTLFGLQLAQPNPTKPNLGLGHK
jgi:hypothetical protein